MKKIILCADDFGYNPKINDAILQLLQNQRLSATSCMTNMPDFLAAKALVVYQKTADIGLHFNLTEGIALTDGNSLLTQGQCFLSLPQLLLKSHFRRISASDVYNELVAQYNRFVDILGFAPHHIDGHQHIHHLPIIRDVLIQFIKARGLERQLYVRNVSFSNPLFSSENWFKKQVILSTGARNFQRKLQREEISYNIGFSGIYAFGQSQNYRDQFLAFLNDLDNGGLIMCHPSLPNAVDSIGADRQREYDYLSSAQFIQDCHQYHIELTKLHF